jgi:sugar phosphate isomerase/epimerase
MCSRTSRRRISKSLKEQADRAGLKLYVGTGSVCKVLQHLEDTYGTPEEHLSLTIRIAKGPRLPRRTLLPRQSKGPQHRRRHPEAHRIDRQNHQGLPVKAEGEGIKIAIENHAGDMQSHELKALIEAAGKGYVGANIDPGNAVWALEEPLMHLEVLGPLTICSSVRDSMLWEDENGAVVVQWTAVGEGLVDYKAYAKRFAELAPGVPLQVETISGFARPFAWKNDDFWKIFPNHRDTPMFKAWLDMAKRGKKIDSFKAPDGPGKKDAEIAYQKGEAERSFDWLRANA